MPRPITGDTKLAKLIRADGRPAYQIAGAAMLKDWQLAQYYSGRVRPSIVHQRRICAALECDPEDILEERYESDGELRVVR